MSHPDFRVGGRIFATMGYPRAGWAMIRLTPEEQAAFTAGRPKAFVPVKGKWGEQGCTNVVLKVAPVAAVRAALRSAHDHQLPRKGRARSPLPTTQASRSWPTAAQQLRSFIAKFEPGHRALIHAARRILRRRLPSAHELVYDNYNFFVIGFSPTERPSDAILSIAAGASSVGVCFIHGARLPDPQRILQGAGKQTRFVRLESAAELGERPLSELITAAIADSRVPLAPRGRGRLIIRAVSSKQRPRR